MLEAIIIILFVAWLLGYVAFHATGYLIHALLVLAIVILIIRIIRGRRVL
ncbi:MAG: lmo0937 family membrane protein [Candidatus Omnitrophota bacterium]